MGEMGSGEDTRGVKAACVERLRVLGGVGECGWVGGGPTMTTTDNSSRTTPGI